MAESSVSRASTVPPTGTAEKFIGILGSNLTFVTTGTDTKESVPLSGYDVIRQLGLKLGDPRLDEVKATFSRLTQVAEVRGVADPTFPYPEPGQPLVIPESHRESVTEAIKQGQPIVVDYESFAGEFAKQLRALGMDALASKLTPSPE